MSFIVTTLLLVTAWGVVDARGGGRWRTVARAEHRHSVDLCFILRRKDPGFAERRAEEVSDPRNPLYGQYLKAEEAIALLAPAPGAATSVKGWLESHGAKVAPLSSTRPWEVRATLAAPAAEAAFGVTFCFREFPCRAAIKLDLLGRPQM